RVLGLTQLKPAIQIFASIIRHNKSMASSVDQGDNIKYILVTGGVISGIGKGIISSSLGTLLKACGYRVTSIKIDPYINIDAGTFSPYEHGEVYVLDDGAEVDLDLGNYERYLDVTLHRDNNITTGKIYQQVINKERRGDFLGKTVQVVPHITDAVQEWVQRVARVPVDSSDQIPQICIVELGGVIGDIESMPFVEAFRQFQFNVGVNRFACIHVSLVPEPRTTGEQKTKPTQMSVRELRALGLSPHLLACRCATPLNQSAADKLAMFCHVAPAQVINVPDANSLYKVPIMLKDQGVHHFLLRHFQLDCGGPPTHVSLDDWHELAKRDAQALDEVHIGIVGKYVKFPDAYTSITKALEHACLDANLTLRIEYINSEDLEQGVGGERRVAYHNAWQRLCSAQGIIVPGGFGDRGVEGKINAIDWCRKMHRPFLGICLGMQCAVIEFARNVLGWRDANSTEFSKDTQHPVVIDMPEFNPGDMGGTMRLGKRRTTFVVDQSVSTVRRLYKNAPYVEERHRHRFEVNPKMVDELEQQGLRFTGRDGERMEILELAEHPYFVGVQFHPEYLSRPMRPSPVFTGLVLAVSGGLQKRHRMRLLSEQRSIDTEQVQLVDRVKALDGPSSTSAIVGGEGDVDNQ
ncbi:hypothetical protein BOX15_Mlig028419g1, partial [Macrostomum lignano]